MPTPDIDHLISPRSRAIDASGIRRVFDLAATKKSPINLSIGQPDFEVPGSIQDAAIAAIRAGHNSYTVTVGISELREAVKRRLARDVGWDFSDSEALITSGTSGGVVLAYLAMLGPGDEAIIPDPYFVLYPHAATLAGGRAVRCPIYPDFRMTADRVEPLITARTKFIVLNSPANPSGVVLSTDELRDLVDLCERRNILIVSDEIYDEFTYADGRDAATGRCPTPGRLTEHMLILRGFSKTYGMTGWRLGYAAGPKRLIQEMAKLQQYTYVCAPSMVQFAGVEALRTDMSDFVAAYQRKRDIVVEALDGVTELARPTGAFYAFPKVPDRLRLTASEFVQRSIDANVLIIPGNVFSGLDTHFRLSFATSDDELKRGLDILVRLMR